MPQVGAGKRAKIRQIACPYSKSINCGFAFPVRARNTSNQDQFCFC